MLDSLPVWARDLILLAAPVLVGWVSTTLVPQLQTVNPLLAVLAASILAQVAAWVTHLTRAYGRGSANPPA